MSRNKYEEIGLSTLLYLGNCVANLLYLILQICNNVIDCLRKLTISNEYSVTRAFSWKLTGGRFAEQEQNVSFVSRLLQECY